MNEREQEALNRQHEKELWTLARNLEQVQGVLQRQISALSADLKNNLRYQQPDIIRQLSEVRVNQKLLTDIFEDLQQDVNNLKNSCNGYHSMRTKERRGMPLDDG